ncbi:MAG: hypothetical protein ACJ8GV_10035 [Luteimonas sp.]
MSRSPLTPPLVEHLYRRLPTFVQRAFSSVRVHDKKVSAHTLRSKFKQAENAVAEFKQHTKAWIRDVDEKMERLGMERVDRSNPEEADEFLRNVGQTTLEKKSLREALIYVADSELTRLMHAIEERERGPMQEADAHDR